MHALLHPGNHETTCSTRWHQFFLKLWILKSLLGAVHTTKTETRELKKYGCVSCSCTSWQGVGTCALIGPIKRLPFIAWPCAGARVEAWSHGKRLTDSWSNQQACSFYRLVSLEVNVVWYLQPVGNSRYQRSRYQSSRYEAFSSSESITRQRGWKCVWCMSSYSLKLDLSHYYGLLCC